MSESISLVSGAEISIIASELELDLEGYYQD